MNAPVTLTATVAVWIHNNSYGSGPQDLMTALQRGDQVAAVSMLAFYGPTTKEKFSDCVRVGEADVTVRLIPRDEQTRLAVNALNEQLQKLRAAYHERQQEIMAQISKLQALTNEVEA